MVIEVEVEVAIDVEVEVDMEGASRLVELASAVVSGAAAPVWSPPQPAISSEAMRNASKGRLVGLRDMVDRYGVDSSASASARLRSPIVPFAQVPVDAIAQIVAPTSAGSAS